MLRPKEHDYLFGRVVKIVPKMLLGIKGPLIYIYKTRSPTPTPVPELNTGDLLVPPIGTNFLPWSRGYFQFIEHRPLCPSDVLKSHCFYDPSRRKCYDEEGGELAKRTEPCGFFGIESYRTIDDAVSRALGIPLVPD